MTRKFARLIITSAVISTAATAWADIIGIRAHLGYHWTGSFELRNGDDGTMSGLDAGIDFPMGSLAGIQLYASPSVVFGGKFGATGIEGHIYRFTISGRRQISPDGLYATASAGVAHSQASASEDFRSANGFVGSVGLGVPLKFNFAGISPNLEGRYYFSSEDQFRGFTIGFSVSF